MTHARFIISDGLLDGSRERNTKAAFIIFIKEILKILPQEIQMMFKYMSPSCLTNYQLQNEGQIH